jgi:succinoglycan biosynthesis transport protein ExoP
LSDSLTALFLQIKAFNATASAPIELQVDSGAALSDKSLSEQIAFLDSLAETLEIKSGHIDTLLANLEPDILALQQKLEGIQVELDRLTRARDIARETYMSLSRKLDEARIAAQEEEGILQVGSYAAVPKRPAGPRKLISTALAAILGLMVGVAAVLVLDFWRGSGTTSAK